MNPGTAYVRDPWLDRRLPLLRQGFAVTATDIAVESLRHGRQVALDCAAVETLFARGWQFLNLEELTNHRYEQPKVAWEAVLRATGQSQAATAISPGTRTGSPAAPRPPQ